LDQAITELLDGHFALWQLEVFAACANFKKTRGVRCVSAALGSVPVLNFLIYPNIEFVNCHGRIARWALRPRNGSLTLYGELLDYNASMVRKIFACFALLIFICSALTTLEQFSPGDAPESPASFASGDEDGAQSATLAIGVNCFARAKSLPKAWISSHSLTPHVGFTWSSIEISLTRPLSKYGVYQQINVYRL
jgi:hypothetical protein